jgi:hypothetical protein
MLPEYLVLPVSGQLLIGQLGIMLDLTERGYKPTYVCGTSGGAIVGSWGLKNHWDTDSWFKEVLSIQNTQFFKGRPLLRLRKESLFLPGPGLEYLYNLVIPTTHEQISYFKSHQMLVNAYNESTSSTDIFSTNVTTSEVIPWLNVNSQIQMLDVPDFMYTSYWKEVIEATSAIPVIFPPIRIDNYMYSDGGTAYVSGLNLTNTGNDVLYVSPYDFDLPIDDKNKFTDLYSETIRTAFIQDRFIFLSKISKGEPNKVKIITGNQDMLSSALIKTSGHPRFVELYPTETSKLVGDKNYSRDDYISNVVTSKKYYSFKIFYIQSDM